MNTSSGSTALPKKPTILVVDDEAGPRDALKVILRPFFEIHTAENAHAALRALKEHHIDLITLDQKLPDRQGIDLLQDIKHEHADVEVIIITGYGSLKSAMEGIRHGAAGYLLKPFNVTELIALINQTLEKKQRLDFLRRFLKHAGSAWETEQDCAKTWIELKRHYPTSLKSSQEGPTPSNSDMTELLPLLSDLLEAKDRHLLNHCSRVSFYATLLANRLNLTMAEQKSLALGAFLHDIGKIALDPYAFSHGDPPEAENLKRHPEIGARMMLPLGFSAEVTQIIAYHHERYDGFGYPHGLQGEGIPLLARIVAIAQAFDHLTADSPTRPTTSIEEAVRRISLEAETRFDPILTEVFVRVVNECKASLPAMAFAALPTATQEP